MADRVPRVFWRGSSTGADIITLDSLPNLPRFRLCAAGAGSKRLANVFDAKLTNIVQASDAEEARKIREYVDSRGLLSTHVPQIDFVKYRFQIDIDGNSNSWSFLPKLMMGACLLKVVSRWRQWYYDGLHPWEHYVPVKNDLSDLEEQVAWCLENGEQARQIATNGMKFAHGIVFGNEMLKAASSVFRSSRETQDLPS
jgi:Glycosyl transferase family 90